MVRPATQRASDVGNVTHAHNSLARPSPPPPPLLPAHAQRRLHDVAVNREKTLGSGTSGVVHAGAWVLGWGRSVSQPPHLLLQARTAAATWR
jgi:hypothetical protein